MTIRTMLQLLSAVVLGAWVAGCATVTIEERPPNILLAISDDQGHIHAGPYGFAPVRTPTLDRLAEQGALFNNAFVASPMCTVARASLFTGRNPWQNGEAGQHGSHFPAALVSYVDVLEQAGYAVGYTGKAWSPGDWEVTGLTRNPGGYEFNEIRLDPKPTTGIFDSDYARNFEAFLEQKSPHQPFAFVYGAKEPHGPYEKGSGLRAGYTTDGLTLTPNFPDTSEQVKINLLDYFLEIEWFDTQLGQIINILREKGELDNTLILVTGDNGSPVPGGKSNLYDLGTHVPLVAVWQGKIKAGRVVDDLVSQIDFAPTFLEAAGLETPSTMTGRSLLDLLLADESGRLDPAREYVLAGQEKGGHQRDDHLGYPMRSIHTHDYLYIRNFRPERWPGGNAPEPGREASLDRWKTRRPPEELFRIGDDPFCLDNLADDPAHAETLAELRGTLERELRAQNDPRVLGYGDIYESFPRYMSFNPELKGFKERGEYNPEYLMEIPPEIFVSELYYKALGKKKEKSETIRVGERDLQQVIDAAAPHSTIVADRNRQVEIDRTITIDKPITLVGLNARLKIGRGKTPIVSVLAEGVRIRDFQLTGNADSVTQEDRAPLIEIRRGRFVIENGETNSSSKDGIMITPLPEYGDIEHGVVRNITSRGTVRDTVSIGGIGEQGYFVRHLVVENIRAYDSELRGPVEVSDGSEYITVRDVYAESCRYGVDVQDHSEEGQVNRHVIIDGLHVKDTLMAVRTANHDFGHDGLTIRNVTATDWPTGTETPFYVRNTSNLLIENVRLHACPVGPCLHVRNSDNVTLRDISLIEGQHDGPGLLVEDGNNVLIDNVTITGARQPQFGVAYRISSDETFAGLRIRNVLAPDARGAGIVLQNRSESGRLDSYELSGNVATVHGEDAIR